MKYPIVLIAIFISVGFLKNLAGAEISHVQRPAPGERFVSPDKRFAIWLEDRKQNGYVGNIETNETRELLDSFDLATTVTALLWTGDSRTIISILQLSGGPRAYLTHLNDNGNWISADVNLPSLGSLQKEMLVECKPLKSTVILKYAVQPDHKITGLNPQLYLCSFELDPDTGVFSEMNWKSISAAEFDSLKSKYLVD